MKKQTTSFIPGYREWKEQCRLGAKALPVTNVRHSTNEIHHALLNLKMLLNGNDKILYPDLR